MQSVYDPFFALKARFLHGPFEKGSLTIHVIRQKYRTPYKSKPGAENWVAMEGEIDAHRKRAFEERQNFPFS